MQGGRTLRRTKIVCTIGPASESAEQVTDLIAAGMDVARLNFSHGTLEEHATRLRHVRDAEKRAGRPIGILLDIQGPKIRIGTVPEYWRSVAKEIGSPSRPIPGQPPTPSM